MIDKNSLLHTALAGVIEAAGAAPEDAEKLLTLAWEELSPLAEGNERILDDLPSGFGEAARLIRRSGEMPAYFAKAVALWYARRGIGAQDIKKALENECGLGFEREFLQLVWEASACLPNLNLDENSVAKIAIMKKAHRLGYGYERDYRGCAQCTLAATADVTGREDAGLFRAASGFAAGMAQLGDGACGGYSGGMMSIGMFTGRRREFFDGDKEEKTLNNVMSQKLHEKFMQTYGSVICRDIHNGIFGRWYDLTVEGDKEAFERDGAHSLDKCPAVVGAASAWTAEILADYGFICGEGEAAK